MARRTIFKRDIKRYSLPPVSNNKQLTWGGLNTNDGTTQIGDNQAQSLLNVKFTQDLEKRGGFTPVNGTAIDGSTGIYGLFPYYYNNGVDRKLIYISHTVAGEINTATGGTSSISGITLTSNQRTNAVTFHDLLILTNGSEAPQKIDESTGSALGGSPPITKYIALHKNYLFLSGNSTYPSRVYYSTLDTPETWGANDFFDVNPNDGDSVTGLSVTLDTLIIMKEYNMYILYGDTPTYTEGLTLWRIKKASVSTGSVNQGSMQLYGKNLFYLSRNSGVQLFGGSISTGEVEVDNLTSALASKDITPTIASLNESRFNQSDSVVWDYKYILSVPNGASTTNNLCLVYDFIAAGWSLWDIPANCWSTFRSSGVDYLYFGSTTTGKIYRYTPTIYSDNGVAINAYYKTKDLSITNPSDSKLFRKFYVTLNKAQNYSLTVKTYIDISSTAADTYTIAAQPSSSLWGTMVWGTDKWGTATTAPSDKQVMNNRGKFINYKFSNNNLNETMKIRDFTQYFRIEGSR